MQDIIFQLYPYPSREVPLKNLYIQNPLHEISLKDGQIHVYSNYIASLDGRIAIENASKTGMTVPHQITNPRDWRLVQELSVHADLLITSGRYLRGYAKGGGQKVINVYDEPQFADLKEWRESNGLKSWPDLAIISNSLDFSIPAELSQQGRSVIVITSRTADQKRVRDLEAQGGKVILAGQEHVEGKALVEGLADFGYRRIYSITGPKVLHLLLAGDVLNRLYLTFAHKILGGSPFSSIVEGSLFEPSRGFKLRTLYFDPYALDNLGQLYACYDRAQDV